MTRLDHTICLVLTGLGLVGACLAEEVSMEEGFRDLPRAVRTRVFWRVFGPAWERQEIDYQLDLLKEAGVGGVMTFFVYPVAVDGKGVHNQRFLDPEFLEHFAYAARRCRELGLRFGVAGGTGWPFGGPTVTRADAAQRLGRAEVSATAGGELRLPPLGDGQQIIAVFQGANDVTERALGQPSEPRLTGESGPITVYVTGLTGLTEVAPGQFQFTDLHATNTPQRFYRARSP